MNRLRHMNSEPEVAPRNLAVTINATTPSDLARGLHEATLRIAAGERWGSAADETCWVTWNTLEPME